MRKEISFDELINEYGEEIDLNEYKIVDTQYVIDNVMHEIPAYTEDDLADLSDKASTKLKNEKKNMEENEKNAKIKSYVVNAALKDAINEARKNGQEISGPVKRKLRRKIERQYDKGKMRPSPEQADDILYEINKFSNIKEQTKLK